MTEKEIVISETIKLDKEMTEAYELIKQSYEIYKTKENLSYSFNEYLIRCGLISLLSAFDVKIRENKRTIPTEGHA